MRGRSSLVRTVGCDVRSTMAAEPSTATMRNGKARKVLDSAPFDVTQRRRTRGRRPTVLAGPLRDRRRPHGHRSDSAPSAPDARRSGESADDPNAAVDRDRAGLVDARSPTAARDPPTGGDDSDRRQDVLADTGVRLGGRRCDPSRRGAHPGPGRAGCRRSTIGRPTRTSARSCARSAQTTASASPSKRPTPANRCAALREAVPQSLRQQELVCLTTGHVNCPRYLRGALGRERGAGAGVAVEPDRHAGDPGRRWRARPVIRRCRSRSSSPTAG